MRGPMLVQVWLFGKCDIISADQMYFRQNYGFPSGGRYQFTSNAHTYTGRILFGVRILSSASIDCVSPRCANSPATVSDIIINQRY